MNPRILSWNIAGGHPIQSEGLFDYGTENLEYFIEQIQSFDPDIICLQEAHTDKNGLSNADQIAKILGYAHVLNSPASISHIEAEHMLGTAVISKAPFVSAKTVFFPNPDVDLYWPDGRKADTHEKNIQIIDYGDFIVANNQMLPIKLFGYAYDDKSTGEKLATEINVVMEENISNKPIIWCGDFNVNDPLEIYPFLRKLHLTEALPATNTRPSETGVVKRPDHIFYSAEFILKESGIEKTNSDHFLCFAEFGLK